MLCAQRFSFVFQRQDAERFEPFETAAHSVTSGEAFHHLFFLFYWQSGFWLSIVARDHTASFLSTAVTTHDIVRVFFGGMKEGNKDSHVLRLFVEVVKVEKKDSDAAVKTYPNCKAWTALRGGKKNHDKDIRVPRPFAEVIEVEKKNGDVAGKFVHATSVVDTYRWFPDEKMDNSREICSLCGLPLWDQTICVFQRVSAGLITVHMITVIATNQ